MRDLARHSRDLLDRGKFDEILRLPLPELRRSGGLHWYIGALVLTGDLERALALAPASKLSHRGSNQANSDAVEFFLILGLTRAGEIKGSRGAEARLKQLTKTNSSRPSTASGSASGSTITNAKPGANRRTQSKASDNSALSDFFIAQAQGFMAYFSGESKRPIEFAQSAMSAAEIENWDFARLLATDLFGHSLIRAGQVRRGLRQLRQALKIANRLQNEGLALAIRISILKYEVAHGLPQLNWKSSIHRLEMALKTWVPHDSYSQSELRLELAKQLALRGQVRRAREVLELAADAILGSRNRTQASLLHARLAWLARLDGRWSDARLAIASAKQFCLTEGGDEILDPPLLQKLDQMLVALNVIDPTQASATQTRAAKTARRSPANEAQREIQIEARITQRIFGRQLIGPNSKPTFARSAKTSMGTDLDFKKGEDQLGDALDLGFLASLRAGLLGTLRDAWTREGRPPLQPEAVHLLLGLPHQLAVIFDRPDTRITQLGRRPTLLKALQVLQSGEVNVEDFVHLVWSYKYQPQIHDRLIAVTLTRIRKELGMDAIERRGSLIRWKPHLNHLQLQVHVWTPESAATSTRSSPQALALEDSISGMTSTRRSPEVPTNAPTTIDLDLDTNLNLRQLLLLREIAKLGSISMEEHRDRNGISRATALRDLNELQEQGWVKRLGATRATRYVLRKFTAKT
ncbi:MAG TPA: DeoR family transcriptional regulator [Pseudobdellovibrionaceae bacterium]|nr:DeoR family transcriptional regulator [Pseudobdellovibrionaceae bacterium]